MNLKAKAPAKINLFLHVVGKRSDGYHLLESVFAPLHGLYDEIEVSESPGLSTTYSVEVERDIILKTAKCLQAEFGISKGAHFKVTKNIPIAAGLGGGSSNAAAAIKLLNELWGIGLSHAEMVGLAVEIGADVPFFIEAKPAFIQGVGEIITPLELGRKYHMLVVNPGVACSTADIFGMDFCNFDARLANNDNFDLINLGNSLTTNACLKHPEIQDAIDFINSQNNSIISRMSGTGATCFGLFDSAYDTEQAKKNLPKNWWSHSEELIL